MTRAGAGLLMAALAAAVVAAETAGVPLVEVLTLRTVPVALDATDPGIHACGKLTYRGGLAVTAPEGRFGGFSAMAVSGDGQRLTAISDEGRWLTATLRYDGEGLLTGLEDGRLGSLRAPDGQLLADKTHQDAESMALLPDGSLLVGFEHRHRLWRYRRLQDAAEPYLGPSRLARAPANGGIESIAVLPDGRVLALTEFWLARPGLRGWVGRDGKWKELWYPLDGAYRPSDACSLPDGDLLVLERAYNRERGITGVRLVRVAAAGVKAGVRLQGHPIAELRPPFVLDNFEGLACRRGRAEGETLIYLLSDDNFNPLQRTLLLLFALN